jgi:membrane-associated phospholipid phosphatase
LPWSERAPAPRRLLVVAAATATLAVVCITTLDPIVARLVTRFEAHPAWPFPTQVLEWIVLVPLWAWALTIGLCAGMVVTSIVPRLRASAPAWMFVAGVNVTSRFLTNLLKDATDRPRPYAWVTKQVESTFGEGGVSFPSGHVSLFASVIIPLVVLYPRLRPLLAVIVFVAAARVATSQHFLSDTLGAVTLVTLVTWLVGQAVRPLPAARPRASR